MSWRELLDAAEAVRAGAVPVDPSIVHLRLAGLGWATVDRERAQAELEALLAGEPRAPAVGPWAQLERDAALGARGWLRDPAQGSTLPALAVLEPDTEGRIAAFLARFGEGVAVIYLGDGSPGPGRLVRGGPSWGPHVIVLESSTVAR
jgi:hypothetical protein